jgi:RNA polymerase sigma-70 factor (ECF subfamily)
VHHELVERATRGDGEAFDALARLVGDRCMAIAFRILRDADQAEDAVQTALIIAWRELRTLRDPDRFEPWLHRILTNECYAPGPAQPPLVGRDPSTARRRPTRQRGHPQRQ